MNAHVRKIPETSVCPNPWPWECVPCPHPPFPPNLSGPDIPEIACWVPEGCCLPSPCVISQEDFLCAVRSLLPEGDVFNNTKRASYDPPLNQGTIMVGCSKVGCEQLVLGGCCDDYIFCDDEPPAPQLAVVDSYASIVYCVILALCMLLREFDPCTATAGGMLRKWAARYGLLPPDECGPHWSNKVLSLLLCILPTLKGRSFNWALLQELAGIFGAEIVLRRAGDFSDCAPAGWWTMARDRQQCLPPKSCPEDAFQWGVPWIRMTGECVGIPDSFNLILCPSDRRFPDNCNNPPPAKTLPHDPEIYEAFKWILPKLLPQPVFWCIYERKSCDEVGEDCIQ